MTEPIQATGAALLGWVPFLQPMPGVQDHWLWLLPILLLGIAMMYKAVRVPTLDRWPREVGVMVFQTILAFVGIAVALFIVVQVLVPLLPSN